MGAGTRVRRVIWRYDKRVHAVIRCVCNVLASFGRNTLGRILGLGSNIDIRIAASQRRFWIRRETRPETSRT